MQQACMQFITHSTRVLLHDIGSVAPKYDMQYRTIGVSMHANVVPIDDATDIVHGACMHLPVNLAYTSSLSILTKIC